MKQSFKLSYKHQIWHAYYFWAVFSLKNVSHVIIQNGGHFKDGGNLRHIFGSFGISQDLLSDFYDINTVSYNGKEQIVAVTSGRAGYKNLSYPQNAQTACTIGLQIAVDCGSKSDPPCCHSSQP